MLIDVVEKITRNSGGAPCQSCDENQVKGEFGYGWSLGISQDLGRLMERKTRKAGCVSLRMNEQGTVGH